MNVEIGAEAALFPEKEYRNGIAVAVHHLSMNPPVHVRLSLVNQFSLNPPVCLDLSTNYPCICQTAYKSCTSTRQPATFSCLRPTHRESAKLFFPVVRIGTPRPPHPQASVYPPPPFGSGGSTLACGRRVGESQLVRGDKHYGTLGICVLCGPTPSLPCAFLTLSMQRQLAS
jgi:hypothetical protein